MDNSDRKSEIENSESFNFGPKKESTQSIENFYFLNVSNMWRYFKGEHLSFWMICCYLFFEYTRPQAIFPSIDVLPWAQVFLLGSLFGAFIDKKVSWVSSPVNFWMMAFGVVIYISSINAYYPEFSQQYFIDFYSWFIVYFLIINIVNSRSRFYIFLLIFILCAAKIALGTTRSWAARGFSFTNWGLMGPSGYFANSGELAVLMLTLFPVAYLLFDYFKNKVGKIEKYILIVFWLAPVLTILGASSRGAQVALVCQVIVMFRRKFFRPKSMIAIALAGSILYSFLPEEQKSRFESAGGDRTSVQRLLYWKHGWDMLKAHPTLGVGYFNFAPYYQSRFPEDVMYGQAQLPHNIFIQVGTDVGFIGLSIFFMILIYPFLLSWRMYKSAPDDDFVRVACVGTAYGLLGFVLAGQFVTITYYPFLWIGLAFIVAGNNILSKTNRDKETE